MLVNATRRELSVELFGVEYGVPVIAGPVGVQGIADREGEEATARACEAVGVSMVLSTAATRSIEVIAGVLDRAVQDKARLELGKESESVSVASDGNAATSPAGTASASSGPDGHAASFRSGQPRWFQLYWPQPKYEAITASLLHRAKAAGYTVLVVTLDTFTLGHRPSDLDTAYLPFLYGEGCQIGLSDPVFQRIFAETQATDQRRPLEKLREAMDMLRRPGSVFGAVRVLTHLRRMQMSRLWLDVMNSGTYREWEHLRILREIWGKDPIVVKGIQTVEDARRAVEFGVDGIVVSNHGGRQLDGAVASLDALAEIAADELVRTSGMEVLFDSGIRTGTDIVKALCLGAKACLVARPYMYGLAMGGQAGVEHVFKCILAEMDNALAQMGKTSLKQLSRDDLVFKQKARL